MVGLLSGALIGLGGIRMIAGEFSPLVGTLVIVAGIALIVVAYRGRKKLAAKARLRQPYLNSDS
jgi:hypothetical protein